MTLRVKKANACPTKPRRFFRGCKTQLLGSNLIYLHPKANDKMKRRLSIAVRLLADADDQASDAEANRARRLVAGVLYGIWFQCDIQSRIEQPSYTPAELFKALIRTNRKADCPTLSWIYLTSVHSGKSNPREVALDISAAE